MLLTSFSTTSRFKLLEETKRDTEKENQGTKKKRKKGKDGGFYGHIRHLHLLLLCMKQIGRKI
jgi:hypothetical protein